jgi:glutamate-1-semialdehyde 2,1-aminomutase
MSEREPIAVAYLRTRPRAAELHARAKELFAAQGATHFARVRTPTRPYITHAMGSRKWDVDGHEYIDYVLGHGSLILGHSHPAVVEAVQRQAAKGLHFGDNHAQEIEWAELIRRMMPSAERIEFFASGQEANQMGLRVARAATGRKRLLKFRYNYHGWADELGAEGSPGALDDQVTVLPANDLELVERELASQAFAVVLIEGGGGRLAGRVPIDPDFYRALPAIAAKYGTLFLLDEVVTGFREATGGWQSVVNIKPDLTTVGKAASGGLPAGVLLGRADLMACLSPESPPNRVIAHGGTWNAVPLTCAAGVAACELYRDGSHQQTAARSGAILRRRGNEIFRRRGLPARLYGRSVVHIYLGGVEREDDDHPPTADPKKLIDPAMVPTYKRLDLHLLQRGVASVRGEALILSSAHTAGDLDHTVAALEASVDAMIAEGSLR